MDPTRRHGDGPSAAVVGAPARSERARATRRIAAAALLMAVIGAGLAVHALLPDTEASDIAGDALYAAAAYLAVVLLAPGVRPVVAGALAGGWCVAVELFQLTGIPLRVGADFPPAMLLLGTVFDARDIAVYVVTVAVLTVLDAAVPTLVSRPWARFRDR
jgi:hypothetical protein